MTVATPMNRQGTVSGRVPMNSHPDKVVLGRRVQPEGYTKMATTPTQPAPKPAFSCPHCNKPFDNEKSLKGHVLSHSRKRKGDN